MASRDLDLIIRILKSRQNDANLKKIREDVARLQKRLSIKIDFGKQMAKGMNQASIAVDDLRLKINALTRSFKFFGKESGRELEKVSVKKATNEINKLITNVRRVNREVGGFARDSIDSFSKVTSSVGPATNAMIDMAKTQAQIEKHTTNLDGLTSNLRTKYHSLVPTLGQVAGLFGSVSTNMAGTTAQTLKTYEAIDLLSKKIREIQILGKLRGILKLDQDIRSLKLFRNEIEKLRLDLAAIRGERVAGREFGVTARMVEDLRKARAEVELLREKYIQLGKNVKELEKLNIKFKEQVAVTNKATKALGVYVRSSEKIKELPGKLQTTVTAYAKIRKEIIRVISQMGKLHLIQGQAGAVYPEKFAEAWKKVRAEFKEGSSEIGALLKKIEGLHTKATQQIVDNNLKIAKSSMESIDSQKDDYAALERLTSRQRVSIDQLVQKYRELKAGLSDLRGGVLSSTSAQKLGNQILKESEVLLTTLGPQYRRLVGEINAWTTAQMKNISSGKTVSIMLKDLSGAIERLIVNERVLAKTSKVLGNEQNLLEKRLALARNKAKMYSDAVIKLNEALLRLNPTIVGDAAQIKRINIEMAKLVTQSEAATKAVRRLDLEMSKGVQRTGDFNRALHRTSAEGFGAMIVSQAAWMAGFQVIFGTLARFKAALVSIIDLQKAVVRAMRTTRSETMSTAKIYKAFTDIIVEGRVRTGAALEDLGEIMYQLGSAGLSAEESMAALDSTLANIIGTEADVRNITKLIAGLYNNFADSIVKVDGSMISLSATSKEWKESLIEGASLIEKFTYINDLLVAAFRDNQVEMMEMRDGLKFMIQSGKAANLALDEMVGILSFLNNHMIKSGQAGRAMRVILSKLTKDAAGFRDAFDIEIDLQKPLDFLDIMRKLNERYKGQAISVEELGKVFKRLGLRGAEAFNLMMRNVDTLEATIGNLQGTLEGAAAEMERVRLSDLASQAGIAAAKIESLLRTAVIPLAKVLVILVKGFNLAADAIMSLNKAFDGALGHILKFVATMALVGGGYLLIKNLGKIFGWFGTVILTVTNHVLGFGGSSTIAAGATTNLTKKIFTLGTVAKLAGGAIVFFLVQGLIMMIKYYGEASIRLKKYAEEQGKIYDQQVTYINQLETLLPLLKNQKEINEKSRTAMHDLIMLTGVKIEKGEEDEKTILKVRLATTHLILEMQKLAEIQREIAGLAKLATLKNDMKEVVYWGKTGLGIFEKLLELIKKSIKGFHELPGSFLPPEEIKNVGKAISASTVKIEEFNRGLNQSEKLAKKYEGTKLEEVFLREGDAIAIARDAEVERRMELANIYNEQEKFSDSSEKLSVRIDKLRSITDSLTSSEKISGKIRERSIKYTRIYSSELSSLRKTIGSMRTISTVFKELGTSGSVSIKDLLEKLKELGREESIRNFSQEVEILSERMKAMPQKDTEIKKLVKDATALGKVGVKAVQDFYKEIDILKGKQIELAKVSSQLKMSNLALEISGLGIYANEASRAISGLVSATGKLQNEVNSSKESISKAELELNKLKSTYRLATSGTNEYKKAQKDIMVQRRVMSVLTERLTRHEAKLFDEVGGGIITFKEMQNKTEKFVIAEEDARIELIRMKGALELVRSGSESYEQTLENVTLAQKELSAASSDKIRVEYEEIMNTIKLQSAYSGIERSIKDQVSLLEDWQRQYKNQQEMYENEISQLGSSVDALRDKEKLYRDVEKSIKDQIQKLDEQYRKEEELIKIAEKTGRLTASEAMVQKLSKMSQHEADRLRLQKDLKAVSEDHQAVLARLDTDYKDAISTLEDGVRRIEDDFAKLQVLLAKIAITIGDKIIGDKEIALKINREELDKVIKDIEKLIGTPYTITVKVKYIDEGKSKYRGGLLMAQGGMVSARVTNGEGYIPPSSTMGNLNLLNTLNGGRATASVPSAIAKFHGPGGIDNIPALLPKGSYVLSTKGMAAYERSIAQGATGFQEGGEVNEEIVSSEGEATSEIGRFTIVVQKEGVAKEYPIYGRPSVLRELKEELETERLTKLH